MALHFLAATAFDDLLLHWRRHDDLRRLDEPLPVLTASRLDLEAARTRMRRLRLALHAEPHESDRALLDALCPRLDVVIQLHWEHRDTNRPGMLRCPCGDLVPIPDSAWGRLDSIPS